MMTAILSHKETKHFVISEEIISLMSLLSELKPCLNKVMIIYSIYMRGVQQGEIYDLHSQRATLLLTTLYNTMMSCDTLFETSLSHAGGGDNLDNGNGSEVVRIEYYIHLVVYL